MVTAQEEKILTDEQKEEQKTKEERFRALADKTDRTEEETTEFKKLRDDKAQATKDRIGKLTGRAKTAEEKAEAAEERARLAEEERDALKTSQPPPKTVVKEEIVEINGKKYFTDEALRVQIDTGELSEGEAWKYAKRRDKEELKAEIREEDKTERAREEDTKFRIGDSEKVLIDYPHFSKKHQDFNAEDPLYKLSMELWNESYRANPKGLTLAIKRAKQILRISDSHIDRSEDLGIEGSHAPDKGGEKKKEPTLSEGEEEAAIRQWTRGDVLNPKTGRAYTDKEAIVKALEAKKARMR